MTKKSVGNFVCLISARGGVGKTTLAWKLAQKLKERGKVCIIEVDVIHPSLRSMLGVHEPLTGVDELLGWLMDQDNRESPGVAQRVQEAGVSYAGVSLFMCREQKNVTPFLDLMGAVSFGQLRPAMGVIFNAVKDLGFDFVIVDCPPQIRELSACAIACLPKGSRIVRVATTFNPEALCSAQTTDLLYRSDRPDLLPFIIAVNRLMPDEFSHFNTPSSIHEFLARRGIRRMKWDEEVIGIPWAKNLEWREDEDLVLDHGLNKAIDRLASAVTTRRLRVAR